MYMCESTYMCAVSTEARKKHQIPWSWSHRWLGATVCVLGTELGSPAGAVTPSHQPQL